MNDASPELPTFDHPMHEAVFWRGAFLHTYAGVEHGVTELLARAHNLPEYAELGDVPFTWPRRVRRLTEVLELPGPLQDVGDPLRALLTEFSLAEKFRHLLVHGIMKCGWKEGEPRSLVIRSHHWDAGLNEITLETTIDLLRETTLQLDPLATQFVRLVEFIFERKQLGPRPRTTPTPIEVAPRTF